MTRLIYLIGMLRRLIGDEYDSSGNVITDYLNVDGTSWAAQTMADAITLSVNEMLNRAWETLKGDGSRLARLFPEYHKTVLLGENHYLGGQGLFSRYTMPDDYGWPVGGRFKRDGEAKAVPVVFDDSMRRIDNASVATNIEDARRAVAWVEENILHVSLGGPTLVKQDEFVLRYVAEQQPITVTGSTDVLLRSAWDRQLLTVARHVLEEFKGGAV